MSLADRLQQLIESHENQIKQYESRIERMEREINKNRGGIDEYHSFIEIEKEQVSVIEKFLSFDWRPLLILYVVDKSTTKKLSFQRNRPTGPPSPGLSNFLEA